MLNEIDDFPVRGASFFSSIGLRDLQIRSIDNARPELFDDFLPPGLYQGPNGEVSDTDRVEEIQAAALEAVISGPRFCAADLGAIAGLGALVTRVGDLNGK